jgi:hypothetical protein
MKNEKIDMMFSEIISDWIDNWCFDGDFFEIYRAELVYLEMKEFEKSHTVDYDK